MNKSNSRTYFGKGSMTNKSKENKTNTEKAYKSAISLSEPNMNYTFDKLHLTLHYPKMGNPTTNIKKEKKEKKEKIKQIRLQSEK